jgi:hypothetical protein
MTRVQTSFHRLDPKALLWKAGIRTITGPSEHSPGARVPHGEITSRISEDTWYPRGGTSLYHYVGRYLCEDLLPNARHIQEVLELLERPNPFRVVHDRTGESLADPR